ncbi:MAG: hypothetical protein LBO05_04110 [Deltaproteobacteria bacterium]|nr:hypothetical protein [Deltaproteobacteria bacterium]
MLDFFGKTAETAREAHVVISQCLSDSYLARKWLCERARRVVATMAPAVAGQRGHDAAFAVACVLVHGFALSRLEAGEIFGGYNARCQPAWSDREIEHKLATAESWGGHDKPRGHMVGNDFVAARGPRTADEIMAEARQRAGADAERRVVSQAVFDPERLRKLARHWRDVVDLRWLANRSAVDPALVGAEDFLRLLYPDNEKILCFSVFRSQGQALWPMERAPAGGRNGVWFLPQPVNGLTLPNPRQGTMSRRSEESVVDFRYLVLESDKADMRDWLGFLVRVPLRIEAIYSSGGRSVHALVRVDRKTKREWDCYKAELAPTVNLLCLGGLDPKVLTAVRLTRLPGGMRNGKPQKLLYVRPHAPVRPICELAAERDVEAAWVSASRTCSHAADVDDAWVSRVRRGLGYYARVSEGCREALEVMERRLAAELTEGW